MREGIAKLISDADCSATFTLNHVAVVDSLSVKSITFPECVQGNEGCAVCVGPSCASGTAVPAVTVDGYCSDNGIGRVDVLSIDAEGFDPAIIAGAARTLSNHRARILQFEYHQRGLWASHSLENVTSSLSGWGYDCFFIQEQDVVIRISGCWHPSYEFKQWSNVVCVLRTELALLVVLDSMTPLWPV